MWRRLVAISSFALEFTGWATRLALSPAGPLLLLAPLPQAASKAAPAAAAPLITSARLRLTRPLTIRVQ